MLPNNLAERCKIKKHGEEKRESKEKMRSISHDLFIARTITRHNRGRMWTRISDSDNWEHDSAGFRRWIAKLKKGREKEKERCLSCD